MTNYIAKHDIYPGAVRILDEEEKPRRKFYWDRFVRDHIVTVIIAALMLTEGLAVGFGTAWSLKKEYRDRFDSWKEEYKKELALQDQAAYWTSGEASLENQINSEADLLSRVDIWTTDEAYLSFVCNVWVRVKRGDYPNSVVEVLTQARQYDFFDERKPVDKHRQEITRELLRELHKNVFPANLTLEYAWLEMQKDGALCVLHSRDKYYTQGDMTWRYQ